MVHNLLLCPLLDNEKLVGPNYDTWYRKLKIVLEHERILYVITDLTPEEPAPNARSAVRDAYQKWLSDQTMLRCIMLVMMNDEFNHKFEEAQPDQIL